MISVEILVVVVVVVRNKLAKNNFLQGTAPKLLSIGKCKCNKATQREVWGGPERDVYYMILEFNGLYNGSYHGRGRGSN